VGSPGLGFEVCWYWRTGKTVRSAVVQSAVTALWVYGCFYDCLRLALVFLRELCDGGLEVFDFVDAGEVEDVVDFVCCERGGVCGSHDCGCYLRDTRVKVVLSTSFMFRRSYFCGTCVTFFERARGLFVPIFAGRWYA
jgi:hypothetical protein